MVFESICEHERRAFIFASTSSDEIGLASNKNFRKYHMESSEPFGNFLLDRIF